MEDNNNKFIQFIKRHKQFIKKLILFFLSYFTIVVVNSDAFTNVFNMLFGQEITSTLQVLSPIAMISTMEV